MKLSDIEDADQLVTKDHFDLIISRLENKLDARFNAVDARMNAIDAKLDTKANALDARIDSLSGKIDRVSRTIWIPAAAAIAQILLLFFHKILGL